MKIISVVGARPNFMKVAPIHKAFTQFSIQNLSADWHDYQTGCKFNGEFSIKHLICHTGQHYDEKMSAIFFRELELPKPDFYLGVGGGSHAEQTAKIMIEFEKVLVSEMPDLVIVVGDVNSTIACSLVAVKLGIKVAHVEAGLRSNDRSMPEEINRILTDTISDYLFVTETSGIENLKSEGVSESKIFFVGNCMIDSLIYYLPKIDASQIMNKMKLHNNEFIICTFHRPSNVDDDANMMHIITLLNKLSKIKKIVFPIHPRTKKNMEIFGMVNKLDPNILLVDPIGYIDFLALVKNSNMVITDSGGIQEETTYLGVPCITTRRSTERPVTVDIGTNTLVGEDFEKAYILANDIIHRKRNKANIPMYWDGNAADRILNIILKKLNRI